MKRSTSPSAFDRLRGAFRPPRSFGAAAGPSPPSQPAAPLRASTEASGWTTDPDAAWHGKEIEDGWASHDGRAGRLRIAPGLPGVRVLALAGLLAAARAGGATPNPSPTTL